MKSNVVSIVCLIAVIFSLGLVDIVQDQMIAKIKASVAQLENEVAVIHTAGILTAREWYYCGPDGIVSSEPDGQGDRVTFELPAIYRMGDGGYGPSRPEDSTQAQLYNKKVRFVHTYAMNSNSRYLAKNYLMMNGLLEMKIQP